jgi:hypothetical protein
MHLVTQTSRSFETAACTYQIARRRNLEDGNVNLISMLHISVKLEEETII